MTEASPLPPSEKTAEQLRAELAEVYIQGEQIMERLGEIAKRSSEHDIIASDVPPPDADKP